MVRVKNRYILAEIIPEPKKSMSDFLIEERVVYTTVRSAVSLMHGDYGEAVVRRSLNVKYINSKTRIILIRVNRSAKKILLQALAFVKKIGKYDAFFRTLYVSGTIRSSQKYLAKYQRKEMITLLAQCEKTEEKQNLRKLIENCEKSCNDRAKKKHKSKVLVPMTIDSDDVGEEFDSENE